MWKPPATRRGRTTALATVLFGLVALVAALVAARETLLVAWYEHQLYSSDVATQRAAIERLREVGTARAAKALVLLLREGVWRYGDVAQALESIGEPAFAPLAALLGELDIGGTSTRTRSSAFCLILRLQPTNPKAVEVLSRINVEMGAAYMPARLMVLVWSSGLVKIAGEERRVFVHDWSDHQFPGNQPQLIVLTDRQGRVITWREVGGEPMYSSAKLRDLAGRTQLAITCAEFQPAGLREHTYTLTPMEICPDDSP